MGEVQLATLGAVIAATYEAEPDVNRFSDADKSLLQSLSVSPPAHQHSIADIPAITAVGQAMITAPTAAAQTALLTIFTGGAQVGLVPASDNDPTKFLRADGTWAVPPGGGGGGGTGDMLKSVYDADDDGVVDVAATANSVDWANVSNKPGSFNPSNHTHFSVEISDSTQAGRDMLTAADSAAQTALLDVFTALKKGLVPASGGGVGAFLRADGVWAAPPVGGGGGDMAKAVYDANDDGIVDVASVANSVDWTNVANKPSTFTPSAHTHTALEISDATVAGRNMLTAADAAAQTALLNTFTSALKGLVPASGGGTTNFLRADGTWASPPGGAGGDMTKAVYDTNDDGVVDVAAVANSVDWANVSNKPATFTPSSHTHVASEISDATVAGRNMLTAADEAAQTALLNMFSSTAKGLVPASGGGTANFLRADGTWAAPTASGSGNSVHVIVENKSGGTISAGTPLALSTYGTSSPGVIVADADAAMPCIGIAAESIPNTGTGGMVTTGLLTGVNTSGFAIGDKLYVSASGTLTNVRPTSGLIQAVGFVAQVAASGAIFVALEEVGSIFTETFTIAASDETTDLTTGTSKTTFRLPYAFTVTDVRASVTTAPTGSGITVDVNANGTSILSTPITIDAGEKTSVTATTPPVISTASLLDDSEISIDIDAVGSTVAGSGLKVTIYGYRT